MVNNLLDSDELTPEEEAAVQEGREQIARGEYVTREELESDRILFYVHDDVQAVDVTDIGPRGDIYRD